MLAAPLLLQGQEPVRRFNEEEIAAYRQDPAYQYGTEPGYEPRRRRTSSGGSRALDWLIPASKALIWGMAFIVLAGAAVLLARSFLQGQAQPTREVSEEEDRIEDIEALDLDTLLARAQEQGQLRLASRYLFLSLLRQLSRRGLILWKADKTNQEYVSEIRVPELRERLGRITWAYEYAWYGGYSPSPEQFRQLQQQVEALLANPSRPR